MLHKFCFYANLCEHLRLSLTLYKLLIFSYYCCFRCGYVPPCRRAKTFFEIHDPCLDGQQGLEKGVLLLWVEKKRKCSTYFSEQYTSPHIMHISITLWCSCRSAHVRDVAHWNALYPFVNNNSIYVAILALYLKLRIMRGAVLFQNYTFCCAVQALLLEQDR